MADRTNVIAPDIGRSARLAQAPTLPWGRLGVSGEAARGLGVVDPRGGAPAVQQTTAPRIARLVPWLKLGLTLADMLHTMVGPPSVRQTAIAIDGASDLAVVIYGRSYPGPKAGTAAFVRGIGGPSLGVTARVADDGLHFDAGALQRAYGKPLPRALAGPSSVPRPSGPVVLENRESEVHENLSTSGAEARSLISRQARFKSWQAPHLIPFAEIARLPESVQLAIVASGWKMDSVENLVVLPSDEAAYEGLPNAGVLPLHRGPHPRYNAEVAGRLTHVRRAATTMTGPAIRAELMMIEGVMFQRLLESQHGYHPRVSFNNAGENGAA